MFKTELVLSNPTFQCTSRKFFCNQNLCIRSVLKTISVIMPLFYTYGHPYIRIAKLIQHEILEKLIWWHLRHLNAENPVLNFMEEILFIRFWSMFRTNLKSREEKKNRKKLNPSKNEHSVFYQMWVKDIVSHWENTHA